MCNQKNTFLLCEDGIEKSVSRVLMHIVDPPDGSFYPTLTLMMDSYIISWTDLFYIPGGSEYDDKDTES